MKKKFEKAGKTRDDNFVVPNKSKDFKKVVKSKDKKSDYDDFSEKGKKASRRKPKKEDKYLKSNKRIDKFFEGDEIEENPKGSRIVKRFRRPPKKEGKNVSTAPTDELRLNRYLANAGICSRREADEYIKTGLVTVNGVVVTEMGIRVKVGDDVRFNGSRLNPEKKVYIVMNKPKDCITTLNDPQKRKTVFDLLGAAGPERVYPVGRLDRSTTGVLLLTNDGELTKQLTHPKYKKKKIYHVYLNKQISKEEMQKLIDGVELDDGLITVDAINYSNTENKKQIGVEIHSGRNRIVRRMFEHIGFRVEKLDRVYFAGLTKKNLTRGKWRYLSEKEINMLKAGAYE